MTVAHINQVARANDALYNVYARNEKSRANVAAALRKLFDGATPADLSNVLGVESSRILFTRDDPKAAARAYASFRAAVSTVAKATHHSVSFQRDNEARAVAVNVFDVSDQVHNNAADSDDSAAVAANKAAVDAARVAAVREPGADDYQLGAGDLLPHLVKLASGERAALIVAALAGMRAEDVRKVAQAAKAYAAPSTIDAELIAALREVEGL